MNNDNITQAAANKAAEEGGLPADWKLVAVSQEFDELMHYLDRQNSNGGLSSDLEATWEAFDYDPTDRASRQVANKAEVEPVAHLKFWARQSWSGNGNHDVEHAEGLEVCEAGEIGDDGEPAFPVYAIPPATTGASTARDQVFEEAALACEAESVDTTGQPSDVSYNNAIKHSAAAIRALKGSVGARTVLTDERTSIDTPEMDNLLVSYSMAVRAGESAQLQHALLIAHIDQHVAREVAAQAGQVAVPGWINVKDRLPEFDFEAHKVSMFRKVIGVLIDGSVHAMQYRASGWTAEEAKFSWEFADGRSCKSHLVTHWTPLPAAPSPAKESK